MSLLIGQEGKESKAVLSDDERAESVLASLREKVRAAESNTPKIVMIDKGVSRFRCPNHSIMTVVDMSDSGQRVYGNQVTPEFRCDCGTIYKRKAN